jgi:hypothetical protein
MRGHGNRPAKLAKPRLRQPQQSTSNYQVKIVYGNLASEILRVNGSNYPDAIETALTIRRHIDPPHQIDAKKVN